MPLETNIEFLYFSVSLCRPTRADGQTPLTLGIIRHNAQSSRYTSLREFDQDMTRLFDKGRRWHPEGSREYGSVLLLQRLYNALTAPYPMTLPPSGVPDPSPTLFASLPAGPGNARSMHETTQELRAGAAEQEVGFGLTTYRVMSKDRMFTPEARHKGQAYRVGDYIHLINPDDATRPIIGQVWKTFVPTKGYRTHHVTVCWYYRPEQVSEDTSHTPMALADDTDRSHRGSRFL
jgi:chromatin structure-remodeling complex subunit RSC1/2